MRKINNRCCKLALLGTTIAASPVMAADWSTTEVHLQYGDLKRAFQGGGSESETGGTTILTLQHASGWKYGDNFFFIDYLNFGSTDADRAAGDSGGTELYGEWYPNFSMSKIFGKSVGGWFIEDIGVLAGLNFAAEVDALYYLPGVRLSLDIPGFAFANLDVTAYIQDSASHSGEISVREDDSWMVDFNWAFPFTIGKTKWSLEGHVEYIEGVDTRVTLPNGAVVDGQRESWVLAQPQLRLDLGNLWGDDDRIFVGIEWQYWENKLGDKNTDENLIQLLGVWRL